MLSPVVEQPGEKHRANHELGAAILAQATYVWPREVRVGGKIVEEELYGFQEMTSCTLPVTGVE